MSIDLLPLFIYVSPAFMVDYCGSSTVKSEGANKSPEVEGMALRIYVVGSRLISYSSNTGSVKIEHLYKFLVK